MALLVAALALAILSALALGLVHENRPALRDSLGARTGAGNQVELLHDLWAPPVILHPG